MNSDNALPEKIYCLMESNVEALAAIDDVVSAARRELRIFDASSQTLHDRGFGSPARVEKLKQLLLSNRSHSLRIALHKTQGFESELPRLVILLTQFSGQIHVHRTTGQASEVHDTLLIADDEHFWRKPHIDHPRSILTLHDAMDTRPFIERFEEIWEKSEPAVSASTLGL